MEKLPNSESTLSAPGGDKKQSAQPDNFLTRHRFGCLFIALLLFFIFVPMTHQFRNMFHPAILLTVETTMFVGLIGGVSLSISRTPAWKIVTLALGVPAVLLWLLHLAVSLPAFEVIRYLVAAGFLGYAVVLMLIAVFNARKVTVNILCASLCAYLMLGVVWALGYSILSVVDPGAFTATVAGYTPARLRVGPDASMDAMYFSFATLTTLGYGDIVPTAPFARALACLEALAGQLYLAVLVSRLVGMHIMDAVASTGTELKPE